MISENFLIFWKFIEVNPVKSQRTFLLKSKHKKWRSESFEYDIAANKFDNLTRKLCVPIKQCHLTLVFVAINIYIIVVVENAFKIKHIKFHYFWKFFSHFYWKIQFQNIASLKQNTIYSFCSKTQIVSQPVLVILLHNSVSTFSAFYLRGKKEREILRCRNNNRSKIKKLYWKKGFQIVVFKIFSSCKDINALYFSRKYSGACQLSKVSFFWKTSISLFINLGYLGRTRKNSC